MLGADQLPKGGIMHHSKLPAVYHPKAEPCREILANVLKDKRTLAILGWMQSRGHQDPLLPEHTLPRAKIGPVFINNRGVVWNEDGVYWDPLKPVDKEALRSLPQPEQCFPALRRLLWRIAHKEAPRRLPEHAVALVFLNFVDDLKRLTVPDEILTREDLRRSVWKKMRPGIEKALRETPGDY